MSCCKECGHELDDFDNILGLYCDEWCAEASEKCEVCGLIPSYCNCEGDDK